MDNKSLYDKILEASNIIARKARNSGNYIIISSQVAQAFNNNLWNISRSQIRKEKIRKIWVNIY